MLLNIRKDYKRINTPRLGATRYFTLPMESTNSFVPSSIGVGLITNKSPFASLMILVRPPTLAPKRVKGVAIVQIMPGTISLDTDWLDIDVDSVPMVMQRITECGGCDFVLCVSGHEANKGVRGPLRLRRTNKLLKDKFRLQIQSVKPLVGFCNTPLKNIPKMFKPTRLRMLGAVSRRHIDIGDKLPNLWNRHVQHCSLFNRMHKNHPQVRSDKFLSNAIRELRRRCISTV